MTIAIVNHKGGTGKTTTTINLGSALASQGYRVLLVDLDAQASLSYSLGIDDSQPNIADALFGEVLPADIVVRREGMDILPAGKVLSDVELSIAKAPERLNHVGDLLREFDEHDFVLIDCPPSLSLLTLNALNASDYLIVPMQMDVLALRGLDSILETLTEIRSLNPRLEVLGVLPVMAFPHRNMYQEISSHISTNYRVRLFDNAIRCSVKAAEAPSFGGSVLSYAPTCSTTQDYREFAKEVLKLSAEKSSKTKVEI